MIKDFKKSVIFGLIYGVILFILSRDGSSDQPWFVDVFASAIAAIVFIVIFYLLLRLNPFKVFEKEFLKNWKQRITYILIVVMLAESLIIAKTLIMKQKPDVVSLVLGGLGIAVGVLITITFVQRTSEDSSKHI